MGRGSSVSIASRYRLDVWDRIPMGTRYFVNLQTGPGAHPASCTMCTGFFQGLKRQERGADHPPLLAPRSRMSIAIPLLPLWVFGASYRANFTLLGRWAINCTVKIVGTMMG
jgi:hypothetical protein